MRPNPERIMKVGVIGGGGIGGEVVNRLTSAEVRERLGVELVEVAVRDLSKPREFRFSLLTAKPSDLIKRRDIDIIVEVMGGVPAVDLIYGAIEKGKHVVTANKDVMAINMRGLGAAARSAGVNLRLEAAVGGGIPIVADFLDMREVDPVKSFRGIVNGTTNFMLDQMSEMRWDYQTALAEAQRLKIAEPDPKNDVEGIDSMYKLIVLASIAFNTEVNPFRVFREGITGITAEHIAFADQYGSGYVIKLLAQARKNDKGALELSVRPALVSKGHEFARSRGALNVIEVERGMVRVQTFKGEGAGPEPTTKAILSDINRIAQNIRSGGAAEELPSLSNKVSYAPAPQDSDSLASNGSLPDIIPFTPTQLRQAIMV